MTALEEIKKALEGVTPGPWHVYSEKVADKEAAIAESAYQIEHTDPFVGEIFMLNAGGKCPALTGCGPCSEANARYIAAVNPVSISELLSTLESLQSENEMLRASRDGYVKQRDEILRLYDEERISCIREAKLATDMAADCNDAQARVRLLEETLAPFAKKYEAITPNPKSEIHRDELTRHPDDMRDDELALVTVGIGDIRRAVAALASNHAADAETARRYRDDERRRAEAAEAALKPFVAFFDKAMAGFTEGYSDRHPDKIICGVNGAELSISAFINARKALASTGGEHHAE